MFRTGPRNLITDVAGLRVGNASDTRLKSGVTTILCDGPAVAGVQILGGAPGTRETDLLEPHNSVEAVHAVVLSGGSAFGLDAASGVQAALRERGIGLEVGGFRVPIVPAAILFDLQWRRQGLAVIHPTATSARSSVPPPPISSRHGRRRHRCSDRGAEGRPGLRLDAAGQWRHHRCAGRRQSDRLGDCQPQPPFLGSPVRIRRRIRRARLSLANAG